MNRFLCSFATIVAVVNGYATGGGQYGVSKASGPVIGGRAYQIQPAVSQQTIAALLPSYSGYGASYGGSAGRYGGSSSIDIRSLLLAAGGDLSAHKLSQLALSLPSVGGPLIDTTGLAAYSGGGASYGAPSGGNLAYAIAPSDSSYSSAPAPSYSAAAPAPAPVAYKAPASAPAPYHAPALNAYKAPAPAPAAYHAPAPAAYHAPAPAAYHAPAPAPAPYRAASASAPAAARYPSAAAAGSYIAGNSVAAAPASAAAY